MNAIGIINEVTYVQSDNNDWEEGVVVTAGLEQDKANRKLPLQGETEDQESVPGWS